jgi:hypothetical protein
MFSTSRWIAGACGFVFALSLTIARPLSGQSAHKKGSTQMPMNMPMGKKPLKKKARSQSVKKKSAGASKSRPAAAKRPAPTSSARKQAAPRMTEPMTMPMGAAERKAPARMGVMRMPDTAHKMGTDSAHGEMAGMRMQQSPVKVDSMSMSRMPGMHHSADDMMIGPVGVSMERMGSGTTWIPDAVALPSRRRMLGEWMVMAHGFVFAQYDKQSAERGDDQFGSLNWTMLMATHDFAGGRFQARTMLSLDPLTVTRRGYPLLLQTGESYKGQPLHDRQHPHDFWMELGALYQREINKGLAWSVYAAPSGEPALGPVAFMHRPSAMDNPTAPLTHHWQDATHVSFGVLTGGIYSRKWQLEGSVFNGREPDDNRWNFDPIKLDSYSGRVTVNPTVHWSLAGGYGHLKSPEALNPNESMHRVTASVLHGARLGNDGQWASAFIWGANKHGIQPGWSNGFLAESEAILDKRNTLFGRTEVVQKSAADLVVDNPVVLKSGAVLPGFPASESFNVGAVQLGFIRELARTHWATIGLGAAGTLNFVPAPLEPYYGSKNPTGLFVFARLRPFHSSRISTPMNDMRGMQMKPDHD